MTKFHVGDKVKFTFPNTHFGNSTWFACEIIEVDKDGYKGKLVDRGTSPSYTELDVIDQFKVHLGDGRALTLYDESTQFEFPDLIGRAPEPVEGPLYVGPFEARDDLVVDKLGRRILYLDGARSDYQDDLKLAQVVVAALNAYFGY